MSSNIYDKSTKQLIPIAGNADTSVPNLDDLSNVVISSPTDGQIVKYDAATQRWINAANEVVSIGDIQDVNLDNLADGDILIYDAETQKWVNGELVFPEDNVFGYYYDGKFYEEAAHVTEITPDATKVYVDKGENKTYRYDLTITAYVMIGGGGGGGGSEYTAGNGISIISDVISIKVDNTNTNGLQATASGLSLNTATNVDAGAMSATDKAKLDTLQNYDDTALQNAVAGKVDKETGKGLSTNDFTDELKTKLENSVAYDDTAVRNLIALKVDKVTGKELSTNDFTDALKDKLDGLENYDDTAILAALDDKVDVVTGKGLSTEDYTTAEKAKLAGLDPDAEENVIEAVKVNNVPLTPDANKAVNVAVPEYTMVLGSSQPGYAKTYNLTKDGVDTGVSIEIPENAIIKSGTVGTVTEPDVPYEGAKVGDKYIDLELEAATESHVYIPLKDLIVGYTSGNGINISGANEIAVKLDQNNSNGLVVTSTGLGLDIATIGTSGAMSAADKYKLNNLTNYDDTAVLAALDDKVDKVTGKGLSTEDFTTDMKNKLAGIERNAQVNVVSGIKVNNTTVAPDTNKIVSLTIPAKLSDLTNDLGVVADANYVHTDNNYTTAEKTKLAGLSQYDDSELRSAVDSKQDELISGNTIKTINYESILGSGNLNIDAEAKLAQTITTDITVGHLSSGTTLPVGTSVESILRTILYDGSGPQNFTVTFNTVGGSAIASQVVADGARATRPATDPTKSGYTFDNWYTTDEYTTLFDFNNVIVADTTVYAKWTEVPTVTHTVTFNTHGGSSVASQTVADGAKATRPSVAPTKSGYTFDDWYTDDTYATKFNFNTAITADITVHANWTAVVVPYTVTFYDGTSVLSTQSVNSGSTATRPADPTKTGYVFDNWYAESALTNVFNFSTPITADTGVYAKFIENPVPVDVPDLYIGGMSNAEASTLTIFTAKTDQDLIDSVIESHKLSEGSDYHTITLTFGDVSGSKNSIYYAMVKEGVEPAGAKLDQGDGEPTIFTAADVKDTAKWRATHSDVTIDGNTYKVYGCRSRFKTTDTMGFKIV